MFNILWTVALITPYNYRKEKTEQKEDSLLKLLFVSLQSPDEKG